MNIPEILTIVNAKQIGGRESYLLELHFNDGVTRNVDFRNFLENSKNPLIREYLNPDRFAAFSINQGDLIWGDYELCFPIADLYEGRI